MQFILVHISQHTLDCVMLFKQKSVFFHDDTRETLDGCDRMKYNKHATGFETNWKYKQ